LERGISKVLPQGSCCGPGFWNIQYNSLLNLNYMPRTKVVAFADDLLLAIRGESVRAVENYANVELSKITLWSKNKKIIFNEEKSKAMLVSRRKRREQKEIKVYLNNKSLEQVIRMKYLGIIIDHKFRFQEHISYAAERCTKLIYSLSKMAKLSWGIKHAAIETIYKGAILPLLTYKAHVWIDAIKYEHKTEIHQSSLCYKHKNGKGVSHYIKRSALHPDGNDAHKHQTGGGSQTLHQQKNGKSHIRIGQCCRT
jgi:hypothetical protein